MSFQLEQVELLVYGYLAQYACQAVICAFIASLMRPVTERGEYASWIAPPRVGIDNKPGDFEYVKID